MGWRGWVALGAAASGVAYLAWGGLWGLIVAVPAATAYAAFSPSFRDPGGAPRRAVLTATAITALLVALKLHAGGLLAGLGIGF